MCGRITAFTLDEAGQSLVEVSLSAPLLVTLLVGMYEGTRMLLAAIVLQTGTLAGAQYGALSPTNSTDTAGIATAVQNEVTLAQASPTNPVITSSTATDTNAETFVTVQGTFTVRTLFAYPGLPNSFVITRSATLRVRR